MPVPTHRYLLRHGPHSDARVTINGFPVYAGQTPDQDSHTGVINHWLVPGKNTLRAEILTGNAADGAAYFDVDARGADAERRCYANWHMDQGGVKPPPGVLWAAEVVFESDPGVPEPMWTAAPRYPVDPEGTPELWDEVRGLVRAFETANADAVVEAFELKARDTHEMVQLPWSPPSETEKLMRSTLDVPWEVRPITPADVTFRSFQEGRLVHVGRRTGEPLFSAVRLAPGERLAVDTELVFMRHQDRWRIIR